MLIFCGGSRARCLGSTTSLKHTAWLKKLQYSGGCSGLPQKISQKYFFASTFAKNDKSLEFFYYISRYKFSRLIKTCVNVACKNKWLRGITQSF
jgi:hypothetical protein